MSTSARRRVLILFAIISLLTAAWTVRARWEQSPARPPLDESGAAESAESVGPTVTVAERFGDIPPVESAVSVSRCMRRHMDEADRAAAAANEVLRRLRGSDVLEALDRVVIVGSISVGRRSVCALACPADRCVLLTCLRKDGSGYLTERRTESLCSEILRLACEAGVGNLGSLEGPPWGGYDEKVQSGVAIEDERTWTDVDHEAGFLSRLSRRTLLQDVICVAAARVVRPDDLDDVCRASPVLRKKREQVQTCLTAMGVALEDVGTDEFPR